MKKNNKVLLGVSAVNIAVLLTSVIVIDWKRGLLKQENEVVDKRNQQLVKKFSKIHTEYDYFSNMFENIHTLLGEMMTYIINTKGQNDDVYLEWFKYCEKLIVKNEQERFDMRTEMTA